MVFWSRVIERLACKRRLRRLLRYLLRLKDRVACLRRLKLRLRCLTRLRLRLRWRLRLRSWHGRHRLSHRRNRVLRTHWLGRRSRVWRTLRRHWLISRWSRTQLWLWLWLRLWLWHCSWSWLVLFHVAQLRTSGDRVLCWFWARGWTSSRLVGRLHTAEIASKSRSLHHECALHIGLRTGLHRL